ncbi:MAG: oxidative damage protection protein [Bacillota bacterium]|jgi:Fe-S cluster biosynthesis and repair protein YggX
MTTITCVRCGETRARMPFQPFQNDLGIRVYQQICNVCWSEWLQRQQQLINHYGLNLRDQRSKDFLFGQMEEFLFTKAG